MNERVKNILKVVGILLIFILALLLIWWLTEDRTKTTGPEDEIENIRNQPRVEDVFTPEQVQRAVASPTVNARIFAERFGSFSSQASFGNVSDVENIVTPALYSRLQALVASGANEPAENFYSISTRVINTEVTSQTEGSATIVVGTQRTEAIGSPSNTLNRMQDLTLSLQLSGNTWLVNDYEWSE